MGKTKNKDVELVKDFKKKIQNKIKLDKVILFGSRAKGNANPLSDFDLVVISNDFKKIRRIRRKQMIHLLWDYDYPLDAVCYTEDEFKKNINMVTLAREAFKEGVAV